MTELVLDLSRETTICGDLAAHVVRLLERAKPGDKIIVKTRLPWSLVKESLEILEATGKVSIVNVKTGDVTEVVLRVES